MRKMRRNDPCSCGSGKKYKKCCLERDRISKEQEKEREREEQIKREREDRESVIKRDKEMISQMLESKKPEKSRISQMLIELYHLASEKSEYEYIYQLLHMLRANQREIYEEMIHLLWMPMMGSSFVLQEWDLALKTIPYMDLFDEERFYFKRDLMMYLGEPSLLHRLSDHLREHTPKMKHSYTPWTHGKLDFHSTGIQLITLCALERDPFISAEDLYGELQLHLSTQLNSDWVLDTILSPVRKGLSLAEEILHDPHRESMLYPLGWALASALSVELKIPLSRALLGVQYLQIFLHDEDEEYRRSHHSSIVPGEYFIEVNVFTDMIWHLVALFEITPFYVDLLERMSLLHHREAKSIYAQLAHPVTGVLVHSEIDENISPFFTLIEEMIKEKYQIQLA